MSTENERIERALRTLDQRLTELERLLNQKNTIMEERRVPEGIGGLGGKSFLTNSTGGIEKEVRIPVCDVCGCSLPDSFFVCHSCGRKLCRKCIIALSSETLCLNCIKEKLPLDKRGFKILLALTNGLERSSEISRLVQIKKNEVEQCIEELYNLGFVACRGLSIFAKIYVTDKGLGAIAAYDQIYGAEQDVVEFNLKLRDHVSQKARGK